jgi:hypothetical protein
MAASTAALRRKLEAITASTSGVGHSPRKASGWKISELTPY